MENEYFDSLDLEGLTGTPASTWRYWATSVAAHLLLNWAAAGLRRASVLEWLAMQERTSTDLARS